MSQNKLSLSFEFFPPKTEEGLEQLTKTCLTLNHFNPNFFTVTFGASGGNQTPTFNAVKHLRKKEIRVVPHLTGVGMTHQSVIDLLILYKNLNINELIVLRGDMTSLDQEPTFLFAYDLIAFIRQETGDFFDITVAAYPEIHPQAPNIETDLDNLKRKVDAGANKAITQFFFNPDAYFYYLENCLRHAINIPIIPGIMPIHNFSKLLRFSRGCHAEIPLWIRKYVQTFDNDTEKMTAFGIRFIAQMCQKLLQDQAPGLHFYTLNQPEPTSGILKQLNLTDHEYQLNDEAPLAPYRDYYKIKEKREVQSVEQ